MLLNVKATWQSWRTWLGDRKEDLRAPCQAACPVGTNAGLYVSLVAQGRYDEAFKVASEPNPFPSICGRVCTAPCEDECRRGEFDLPIAIRDLKRFASDHATQKARKITPPKKWLAERVAIVGAGPPDSALPTTWHDGAIGLLSLMPCRSLEA